MSTATGPGVTDDEIDVDTAIAADLALSELVDVFEGVGWRDVPCFSVAEAAALEARLLEARDAARDAARVE